MGEITKGQVQYMDSFNAGAIYACHKLLDKLYYIPEAWKTGDTLTLFNIVNNTISDIQEEVRNNREVNSHGKQTTTSP